MTVRAKKHLGQHFLKDENIARKIVASLTHEGYSKVLEVGPGMGVLTKYLIEDRSLETFVIDIDRESIAYLQEHYPSLENRIISGDFLQLDLGQYFSEPFAVIGNFPYNISSQILFKMLDHRNSIPECVGMFQKEVAERVAAKHGNKIYGILSVLIQTFYDIEYLFAVSENVFTPPPKVKSAVIRLRRNSVQQLHCDEKLFIRVVKASFNQRRKTLRNSLREFTVKPAFTGHDIFNKRPEQLAVKEFVELTDMLEKS